MHLVETCLNGIGITLKDSAVLGVLTSALL